jgi:hypothetical protein
MFKVAYVPFDIWEQYDDDNEEEDEDYKKIPSTTVRRKHVVFSFEVDNQTQVKDL